MVDSYIFDFTRVDDFLDNINREGYFDTLDMDGVTPNYKMVLASNCPNDINDCLDVDGTLNDNVEIIDTWGADDGLCAMHWNKGVNGERTMSIANSTVAYDLGDVKTELKAAFIVNLVEGTGYVIAYAINSYSFPVDGEIILPCDGMVWSIKYGG